MQQIKPLELKQHLDHDKEQPILLDVREHWEFELGHIPHSIHIPLGDLLHHLDDLDREREIIAICHHGVRSQQAAMLLERNGFERVTNLIGGIHHWALQVAPEMPRY